MVNLSALAPITTTATALSNLVLVSPQAVQGYAPQTNGIVTNNKSQNQLPTLGQNNISGVLFGSPSSFLFHYEGEQSVTIESDITDHYIENNTPVQDQIALRPEMVMTHGFIGELNDIAPIFLQPLQSIADKLTIISAYTPVISETALIAYNEAFFAYQIAANTVNSAISSWESLQELGSTGSQGESVIGNSGLTVQANQTKQQVAFQQFYSYWSNKVLFTVQTPWAIFQNMAIKTLRAIQSAETAVITDFEVTFKRIRTVDLDAAQQKIAQNRAATQQANNVTKSGTALGNSVPFSPSGHAVP